MLQTSSTLTQHKYYREAEATALTKLLRHVLMTSMTLGSFEDIQWDVTQNKQTTPVPILHSWNSDSTQKSVQK